MHPTRTRKHNYYKIIEIKHTKRHKEFDPFIIAQNARQVYYLSYPGKCKSNWRVVIKCKPRGKVELEEVCDQQAYQTDNPSPSKVVVDTDIPSNLCSIYGEVDIIKLPRQHLIGQADKRDANTEDGDDDEEEEFDDDVETDSDKDSPQFLNNEMLR